MSVVRARRNLAAVLAAVASLAATSFDAPAREEQLPNLTPAPPGAVQLAPSDDGRATALRFHTTTYNLGSHHLDLIGVPAGASEVTNAEQCVSFVGRACLQREVVGNFVFHAAHAHFHFDDYAAYELRRVRGDGRPDFSSGGLVATGEKISFCLMDTDRTDQASDTDGSGTYLACYVGQQGISAGWGDTYTSGLDGQQIVVDDVEPGRYAIVIHVNPEGILLESDHTDNVSWTIVDLGDTAVRVVESWGAQPASVVVREALFGRMW